jgi:hypothetical protein
MKNIFIKLKFLFTGLVSLALVFGAVPSAWADVGMNVRQGSNLVGTENVFYGFMPLASDITTSLMLLQSPAGTNRFRIDRSGNIEAAGYVSSTQICISSVCQSSWPSSGLPAAGSAGNTLYSNGASWAASQNIYNNNGNVGIGTTGPGAKLEVAGQVKITGGSPGANKVLTSDAAGLASWTTPDSGVGGSGTANYMAKFSAGTTLANSVIYDNGTNIGIGTTAPAVPLDVVSTANPGINVGNGTTGYIKVGSTGWYDDGSYFSPLGGRSFYVRSNVGTSYIYSPAIYLGDNSSANNVYLRNNNLSGNNFSIPNSGNAYFNGGNVGIGTTAPVYKLVVQDSATTNTWVESYNPSSARVAGFYAQADTGNWAEIMAIGTAAAGYLGQTGASTVLLNSATAGAVGTYNNIPLIFGTNNTEKMRIAAGGNIGIGTTNPQYLLDVYSNTSPNKSAFRVRMGSDAESILFSTNNFNNNEIYSPVGSALWLEGGGDYGHYGPSVHIGYAGGYTSVENGNFIVPSNNVGIGTTNPAKKLDINGTARIDAAADKTNLVLVPNSSFDIGLLQDLGDNVGGLAAAPAWSGSGAPYHLWFMNGADVIQVDAWSKVRGANDVYFNGGNVGIGTTVPASPLDVESDLSNILATLGYHFDNTSASTITLQKSRGTAGSPAAVQSGDNIGNFNVKGYDGSAYGNAGYIRVTAAENFTASARGSIMTFNSVSIGTTAATEKMRIDGNGNVGIGTTAPGNTLTIGTGTVGGYSLGFGGKQVVTMASNQNLTPTASFIELSGGYTATLQAGSLPAGTVLYIVQGSGGGYPIVSQNGVNYQLDANHGVTFVKTLNGSWICVGYKT